MRQFLFPLTLLVFIIAALYTLNRINKKPETGIMTLYGNVGNREIDLGFRATGRLMQMHFEEGDVVPKGTLMAVLDQQPYLDVLHQTTAHVDSLQYAFKNAKRLYDRRHALVGTDSVSIEDFQNADKDFARASAELERAQAAKDAAETNLRDTSLYAPTDGTIFVRLREPGTIMRQADPIYTFTPTSPVWVRLYVSFGELEHLSLGMKGTVTSDVPNRKEYHGTIGFISPKAEFTPKNVNVPLLRTDLVYQVWLYLSDADPYLHQGMPVTVQIPLGAGHE